MSNEWEELREEREADRVRHVVQFYSSLCVRVHDVPGGFEATATRNRLYRPNVSVRVAVEEDQTSGPSGPDRNTLGSTSCIDACAGEAKSAHQ